MGVGVGVSVGPFPHLLQKDNGRSSLHPCCVCGGGEAWHREPGSFLEARGRMPEAHFPKQFPGPGE